MRALLALVLFILVGCTVETSPECNGTFRLDASLTAAERARVELAAAKWNALAGRTVVSFDDGAACSVRIEEHENLGTWRTQDGSISLATTRMHDLAPGCAERMGDCIEAVTLHELGHALGLRHVDGDGSVMSEDGELLLAFTDADRAECTRAGVC